MILKRHALALLALSFGLVVGACAQVSGPVSDAWPHWAGGEPANTPPRPGAPGYQDFIAHRQAATTAEQQQSSTAADSVTAQPAPVAAAMPPARPPSPAPTQPPSQGTAIAGGGLY